MATNFEPNECVIIAQSTKMGSHVLTINPKLDGTRRPAE